jgi:hypothetical protein
MPHRLQNSPVSMPPSIVGIMGRAWLVDMDAAARHRRQVRSDAVVGLWLIEAHWAHPVWHSYVLSVVHLRAQGANRAVLPPPELYLEGATHELVLGALDPAAPRETMLETGVMTPLSPINFAAQLVEPHDAAAFQRAEAAVTDVCSGFLSPDTDFRTAWASRFGDNMLRA